MAASTRWRLGLVLVLAGGSLGATLLWGPVRQDPSYHRFADTRSMLGLPHFLNVASNLPFLGVGIAGLWSVLTLPATAFPAAWMRGPWAALMAAFFLTGGGSGYYHWDPGDGRLFWDRLPMALGFGAILGIVLAERVDENLGQRLWAPLLGAAVGSLIYARWKGDLRFYGLLQGWVIVLVPILLLAFPGRTSGARDWWGALGLYGLAKVFELADQPVYELGHLISGHTLKHLSASAGAGFLVHHLRTRRPK